MFITSRTSYIYFFRKCLIWKLLINLLLECKSKQSAWLRAARGLWLYVQTRYGSLSILVTLSLVANEAHNTLQLSSYAYCSWEFERLWKSKDSLKGCFENVNKFINVWTLVLCSYSSFKYFVDLVNVTRISPLCKQFTYVTFIYFCPLRNDSPRSIRYRQSSWKGEPALKSDPVRVPSRDMTFTHPAIIG